MTNTTLSLSKVFFNTETEVKNVVFETLSAFRCWHIYSFPTSPCITEHVQNHVKISSKKKHVWKQDQYLKNPQFLSSDVVKHSEVKIPSHFGLKGEKLQSLLLGKNR